MSKFTENVTCWLIKYGAVDENKKELYYFGIKHGLIQGLSILSIIFFSIMMDGLMEIVLFLVAFIPLRIYAGGYHAENELSCYILSTVTCVAAVLAIKYFPFDFLVYTSIVMISAVVIFEISPVSAVNKPLDKKEKEVFGLRAKRIVLIEGVLYCAFIFFDMEQISKSIFICFVLMAITLVVGKTNVEKENITL
jgi:accessory gene regulator B